MKMTSAANGINVPVTNMNLQTLGLPALVLLMFGAFAIVQPDIIALRNLINIMNQASFLVIFALAQTVVLIPRGFDLSLGQAVSMISVITGLVLTSTLMAGMPPAVVILTGIFGGLAAGLTVGLFNGFFSSVVGIRSFVVTLGSLNICNGLASTLSDGRPVFGIPEQFSRVLATGSFMGVPAAIAIAILTCVVISLVLKRTVFGRILYVIGGNARAAEVAGVSVRKNLVIAFCLSGLLVALGAMMLTARTGSGEPNLGGNLLLQAIAAAVMGGVSLSGGRGGVSHAVIGTLAITVLSNGLNVLQISGYLQQIILGAVIIVAVALDKGRPDRA